MATVEPNPTGTMIPAIPATDLLRLEQMGEKCFRAVHNQPNFMGSIFGGQPLGQALAAAQQTVAGWPAHSCTGYFLRKGDVTKPVDYQVELLRNGRRFAARRVLASQAGRPIFDMLCSFHDSETGPAHETRLTEQVREPDSLPSLQEFISANLDRFPPVLAHIYQSPFPIELRLNDPEQVFFGGSGQTKRGFWFRMPSAQAVGNAADHRCLLAFMSDFWLASVAGAPHQPTTSPTSPAAARLVASLNHSLWFHADVRVDQWLLFLTESPWAGQGRGMARGLIYDCSGKLVATAAQELMMRATDSGLD